MTTSSMKEPWLVAGDESRVRAARRSGPLAALSLAVALALLALLTLRLYGEHRFAVVPELVPDTVLDVDTPLAGHARRLLERLAGPALPPAADAPSASAFVPLGDARTALLARLGLVDLAVGHIDVQYYVIEDDEAGHALLESLAEAAARGVRVRVLIDDIGLVGREATLARFAADTDNLELRVFNPTWLRELRAIEYVARFPRVTRRMHNKALVVDGIAGVVGGRNIANEYFDVEAELVFEDMDVLAVGPVAGEVGDEFDAYWYSGLAVDIARLAAPANGDELAEWRTRRVDALAVYRSELDERDDLALRRLIDGTVETELASATVVYDEPDKVLAGLHDTAGTLAPRILELFATAREELLISSPYLIPGAEGMEVLTELAERGVEVSIMTNSFAANDVAAVHAGYRDYRRPLLEIGVRLHEFKPLEGDVRHTRGGTLLGRGRSTLHAKAFVIDRTVSFVGSFNLDPRSALHNTEMGLVIDDRGFAAKLHERLAESLESRAWALGLESDGRLGWREPDGAGGLRVHHDEPGMMRSQRALVWLASWLPIEWLL